MSLLWNNKRITKMSMEISHGSEPQFHTNVVFAIPMTFILSFHKRPGCLVPLLGYQYCSLAVAFLNHPGSKAALFYDLCLIHICSHNCWCFWRSSDTLSFSPPVFNRQFYVDETGVSIQNIILNSCVSLQSNITSLLFSQSCKPLLVFLP